jgi:hypothetical protein
MGCWLLFHSLLMHVVTSKSVVAFLAIHSFVEQHFFVDDFKVNFVSLHAI